MKLYATTTSERASKGQGGNKEISINLKAGSRSRETQYNILFINLDDKQTMLEVWEEGADEAVLRLINDYPDTKTKGKKQKDETGYKCYIQHTHGQYGGCSVPHWHDK